MLNSNGLRKLDMQDLMVFVAVYEQSSVTAVAEALSISQSTVSYSLKKLRTSFEDELFINTRNGMRPTSKSVAMYGHVLQILQSINLCHSGLELFDPNRRQTTFNVCAPEYFELLLLPALSRRFIASGFAVTVNVRKFDKQVPVEELKDGSLDLVICFGPDFHRRPIGLNSQVLLDDDLVCVMDRHSAPVIAAIDIDAFIERRHVYPTPWTSDTNMVDGWLGQQGRNRQIVARTNTYVAALKMIAGTDFVLTLPRRIQRLIGNEAWLACCEAPHGLPGFTLDMLWSEQAETDQANVWFREQVIKVCAEPDLR